MQTYSSMYFQIQSVSVWLFAFNMYFGLLNDKQTLHPRNFLEANTRHFGLTTLASPAWWQYLKADKKSRHQSIIKTAIRYGYLPRSFCTLGELSDDSDVKLFFSTRYNSNHVLHRLLPQPKNTQYHLRQRTHGLILPTDVNAASKKNYLYRMLFSDIY